MISFLITHRTSNNLYRERNLKILLEWIQLLDLKNYEIIIVEQDDTPNLSINTPNTKHIFVKNSGLFSKAWGMNVAIKESIGEVLVFCDSDCIFQIRDMQNFLTLFVQSEGDVGSPNKFEFIRLNNKQTESVRTNLTGEYPQRTTQKKGTVICGGLFCATREAVYNVKMWDEDFRGWGGEDSAICSKFGKLKMCFVQREYDGYHLWHPGNEDKSYTEQKEHNAKLWEKRYCGQESLRTFPEYIKSINVKDLGLKDKYE